MAFKNPVLIYFLFSLVCLSEISYTNYRMKKDFEVKPENKTKMSKTIHIPEIIIPEGRGME